MTTENTRGLAFASLFTALICCCSIIRIELPFTPIPVTLQTYAVFFAGAALSRRNAVLSAFVYTMLGAVGLPVFSGLRSGVGVLAGPTGGFITGFPPAMFVISTLSGHSKSIYRNSLAMLAGLVIIYALGLTQFMLVANTGFYAAVSSCVLPFILPDLIKLGLAAVSVKRLGLITALK